MQQNNNTVKQIKTPYLNELIAATISGKELRLLLEAEVERYAALMKKKGSSIPLVFEEDQDLIINNTLIIKIFTGFKRFCTFDIQIFNMF